MTEKKSVTVELKSEALEKIDQWIDTITTDLFGAKISRAQAIQWFIADYSPKLTKRKIGSIQAQYVKYTDALRWIHEQSKSVENREEFVLRKSALLLSINSKTIKKRNQ